MTMFMFKLRTLSHLGQSGEKDIINRNALETYIPGRFTRLAFALVTAAHLVGVYLAAISTLPCT